MNHINYIGNQMPLYSFIVPTLGRKKELYRLIGSIREACNFVEINVKFEVIVIEQKDENYKQEIVAKYPEVVFIYSERKGLSFNRNLGVLSSKGEILIFADDDCIITKEYFLILERKIIEYPQLGIFCGRLIELETDKPFHARHCCERDKYLKRKEFNLFMGSTHIIRKTLWNKYRLSYDETLGVGSKYYACEETYLFFQLMNYGEPIIYINKLIYKHPTHENISMQKRYQYSIGYGALCAKILYSVDHNIFKYTFLYIPVFVSLPKYIVLRLISSLRIKFLVDKLLNDKNNMRRNKLSIMFALPYNERLIFFLGFIKGYFAVIRSAK